LLFHSRVQPSKSYSTFFRRCQNQKRDQNKQCPSPSPSPSPSDGVTAKRDITNRTEQNHQFVVDYSPTASTKPTETLLKIRSLDSVQRAALATAKWLGKLVIFKRNLPYCLLAYDLSHPIYLKPNLF